jgi:U3 small nucleolar RNA-associated protein 10
MQCGTIYDRRLTMPRVHEYNTERLAFAFLPYHHTPQFLALLSILPGLPPPALRFLHPYIKTPTAVPRRTIVYTAINTPAFLDALHAHTVKVVQAGHQAAPMLSFWASISVEAIFGILEDNSSGMRNMQDHSTERLVLRVLPALNSCMQARHGAETVEACYLIVTVLAGRADLGDKVLDGLMEAVILAHGPESLDACLACLAVIAEQRSDAQIARKVLKRLLAIPDLSARLLAVSKQCRVQRLTLGCVLGALAGFGRSDEHHALFLQLMASGLLSEAHTRSALSTLVSFICDSTPVSGEHGQALEAAAKLAETPSFLDVMRVAAKAKDLDLGSLGLTIGQTLEPVQLDDDSDEEMLDVDDELIDAPDIPVPSFTAKSFLHLTASEDFAQVAAAFEQAVSTKQTNQFLASQTLQRESALQQTVYLSFLARVWSSPRSNLARGAALRAALAVVKQADATQDLQHLTPYLVHALTDPWRPIRRAAADCIAALSEKTGANSKSLVWGSSDLYGQGSTTVTELKADDVSSLLSSMLVPILEESVMDMTFAVPAIRELLDGSHTSKTQTSKALKSHARTTIISFLASHTHLTPLLRVRVSLLPVFDFLGKISDPIRNATILPLIRTWSALRSAQAAALCNSETIDCEEAERAHLSVLRAKETSSVQLLCDIVSGDLSNDRIQLADAAFDRIRIFWPKIKPSAKSSIAQTLLKLSFGEGSQEFEKHCREQALDTLRDVTLDSDTLVAFVGSVPSAVQMPEGPPVKKRRRTSRNEMARVELSSQDDVQRLLRKLTLVLELVEGSNPGEHPTLFRSLFNVFGELQQLKQQSGSELVYLQSMILGALSPIVDTLKVGSSLVYVGFANSVSDNKTLLNISRLFKRTC